jgi:hypothetical protein
VVNDGIVVTTQTDNTNAMLRKKATFEVVATGTQPHPSKWQKGGSDITGATSIHLHLMRLAQMLVIITLNIGR